MSVKKLHFFNKKLPNISLHDNGLTVIQTNRSLDFLQCNANAQKVDPEREI